MKKYKKIIFLLAITFSTIFIGCDDKDDGTGKSNLIVSEGLTISVDVPFASPQNLIETDATYPFTVTMSKKQSVPVVVDIFQKSGDAIEGDDFDFTHKIIIPANTTTATGSITIKSDVLAENTESFTLQIGNDLTSANASVNPVDVTFNIANYTEDGLMIDLEWNTNIFDINGNKISPTTAADLRLLLVDANYNQTVPLQEADGASFESLMLSPTAADGDYYVVADFFDVYASTNGFNVDLTTTFNQIGVVNDLTFTNIGALNTKNKCPNNYYKIAKIIKTGTTYTIEQLGQSSLNATGFNGNYSVTLDDWADYTVGSTVPVEYDSSLGLYKFKILSTNNPYISNTTTSYMIVTVDPTTSTVTVNSNENFDYGGGFVVPVTGVGTVNFCTNSINLDLKFGTAATVYKFNLVKL